MSPFNFKIVHEYRVHHTHKENTQVESFSILDIAAVRRLVLDGASG